MSEENTTENCAGLVSRLIHAQLTVHDPALAAAFSSTYVESPDQSVEGQIRQANNYWRLKLGVVCTAQSIRVREALVECDLENWIRLFSREVAPHVKNINPTLS